MVRDITPLDIKQLASMHEKELSEEFLSKLGSRFLRQYYKAWINSPYAVFLCYDDGILKGALLGSINPGSQYNYMLKKSGTKLLFSIFASLLTRPIWAIAFFKTRFKYYAMGVLKRVFKRQKVTESFEGIIAELTHVFVDSKFRQQHIGSILVGEFISRCRNNNIKKIDLVTPLESPAAQFYEALGFVSKGTIKAKTGEMFQRFIFEITN
jgi:ribosomal protein S18 acetylase RimI-like enzyme